VGEGTRNSVRSPGTGKLTIGQDARTGGELVRSVRHRALFCYRPLIIGFCWCRDRRKIQRMGCSSSRVLTGGSDKTEFRTGGVCGRDRNGKKPHACMKLVLVGEHCGKSTFALRVDHLRNCPWDDEAARWKEKVEYRDSEADASMVHRVLTSKSRRPLAGRQVETRVHLRVSLDTLQVSSSGDDDRLDRLRPHPYLQTDVFALCFSLANEPHLGAAQLLRVKQVEQKWRPEVLKWSPGTPFVLLGMRADQRGGEEEERAGGEGGEAAAQREEGQALARELGAAAYLECSANAMGTAAVQDVLDAVAAVGLGWSVGAELLERNAVAAHAVGGGALAVPAAEEAAKEAVGGCDGAACVDALPSVAPPQATAAEAGGGGSMRRRSSSSSSDEDEEEEGS